MAKIVLKTNGNAAYEVAELVGGDTMSHAEKAALMDEFVQKNALYPVETTYVGETPKHKYGRYKTAEAAPAPASSDEVADLKAQIAALTAMLEQSTEPASNAANPASDEKAKKA